jgi:hypothetical protein
MKKLRSDIKTLTDFGQLFEYDEKRVPRYLKGKCGSSLSLERRKSEGAAANTSKTPKKHHRPTTARPFLQNSREKPGMMNLSQNLAITLQNARHQKLDLKQVDDLPPLWT